MAEGVRTLSRVFGELWARRLDARGGVEKVERMLGKGAGAGMEKCLEGQATAFGFGAITVVTGLHTAGLQSMTDEQMG